MSISKKDLEALLGLLDSAVGCYVNHCDVCVGYNKEHEIKVEFWRLQGILKEMINDLPAY